MGKGTFVGALILTGFAVLVDVAEAVAYLSGTLVLDPVTEFLGGLGLACIVVGGVYSEAEWENRDEW
jgi:hypothetical protein